MVKTNRKRIGLIYNYSEEWIAGSYYILNIIKAVNKLDDHLKPSFYIFHNNTDLSELEKINYPYLKCINLPVLNIIEKVINKISFKFFHISIIKKNDFSNLVDNIYIFNTALWRIPEFDNIGTKVLWIGDFQEEYLPNLFSPKRIESRRKQNTKISKNNYTVVFSSNDSLNDYKKFYPNNRNTLKVLNFCAILPDFDKISIDNLYIKYNFNKNFFIVPNQLFKHKNHLIVLKAAKILKKKNIEFQIVFTGKESDFRNPEHPKKIKHYIVENELEEQVKILGFIDRKEQLCLMKNALAVIQPSFFEGWNTTVEESKALNKFIILSDIPVHREQANSNSIFFDPEDENKLVNIIESFTYKDDKSTENNYFESIKTFANNFLNCFEKLKY